jgi:hypothetical protein
MECLIGFMMVDWALTEHCCCAQHELSGCGLGVADWFDYLMASADYWLQPDHMCIQYPCNSGSLSATLCCINRWHPFALHSLQQIRPVRTAITLAVPRLALHMNCCDRPGNYFCNRPNDPNQEGVHATSQIALVHMTKIPSSHLINDNYGLQILFCSRRHLLYRCIKI